MAAKRTTTKTRVQGGPQGAAADARRGRSVAWWSIVVSAVLALAGLGLTYSVAHKQDVDKETRADEHSFMLIGTAMGFYNVALDGMMPIDGQKQVLSLALSAADRRAVLAEIKARQARTTAWADGHMQSIRYEDASPRYQASLRILQNLVQAQSDQVADAIRILSNSFSMDRWEANAALEEAQGRLDYALR
ncbi:MAG: hypothetical protein JWQ72_3727, partial [Polaromonas sp.]|nr:hypothetical protein [Polaromonas sp.]